MFWARVKQVHQKSIIVTICLWLWHQRFYQLIDKVSQSNITDYANFPDLCRIPWYFQVSRNSRKVVTLTKVAPMQHTSTKNFTGLRWRLRVVYMWDFHHRWFSTTQPTCQCGSRSSLFFVQFPPNLVATWCNNQSSTFLFFNSPHPFPLQNG